jgi:hypothetical protein
LLKGNEKHVTLLLHFLKRFPFRHMRKASTYISSIRHARPEKSNGGIHVTTQANEEALELQPESAESAIEGSTLSEEEAPVSPLLASDGESEDGADADGEADDGDDGETADDPEENDDDGGDDEEREAEDDDDGGDEEAEDEAGDEDGADGSEDDD